MSTSPNLKSAKRSSLKPHTNLSNMKSLELQKDSLKLNSTSNEYKKEKTPKNLEKNIYENIGKPMSTLTSKAERNSVNNSNSPRDNRWQSSFGYPNKKAQKLQKMKSPKNSDFDDSEYQMSQKISPRSNALEEVNIKGIFDILESKNSGRIIQENEDDYNNEQAESKKKRKRTRKRKNTNNNN